MVNSLVPGCRGKIAARRRGQACVLHGPQRDSKPVLVCDVRALHGDVLLEGALGDR